MSRSPTIQNTKGYFNYDPNDSKFGPANGWGDVKNNAEYLRYEELSVTQQRDLTNKCNMNTGQSPIDLCEFNINEKCHEYHQTRTRVSSYHT